MSALERGQRAKSLLDPEDCAICAEIVAQGWSPTPHCRTCHAVWRGTAPAHCALCHRTFGSNGTSDLAHTSRRDAAGDLRRVCRDPADRGLVARPNDYGTEIWRRPPPPQGPERPPLPTGKPNQGRGGQP